MQAEYISIGQVLRNATLFNFTNWRANSMNTNDLLEAVERLFALLQEREISYALVGGIALLQYVSGRNTEDIDLIMALSDVARMPEIEVTYQDPNFVRGNFEALQIDLLLTRNPLFEKVQQQYTTVQPFAEQPIVCATVEGLLLLKLYALPSLYRQGDFARVGLYENDIATLMQHYRPDVASLLDELSTHLGETDLEAVREIVDEIEARIVRFERGIGDGPTSDNQA